MTQEELLERFIESNRQLTEMNNRYKTEGDSRASRRRLAAAGRKWRTERDKLIQEARRLDHAAATDMKENYVSRRRNQNANR